jgi:tRNA pseudouridine32 synthase / 23S rRNA pseudouridine746 synthase
VFQDEHLVVVDKPSGLLSVPGKGAQHQDCVASRVRAMFPRATGPLTVHRLDMDTSGLLVLGLTPEAQRSLSRQFEARSVQKEYEALVTGNVQHDTGTIDIPIRLDPENRPVQVIDFVAGKPSRTSYAVLARETSRTRLRLTPHTGRTHQLRVHCAAATVLIKPDGHAVVGGLGAPILGDGLYGDRASGTRLMLHAGVLEFQHPVRSTTVRAESSTPF